MIGTLSVKSYGRRINERIGKCKCKKKQAYIRRMVKEQGWPEGAGHVGLSYHTHGTFDGIYLYSFCGNGKVRDCHEKKNYRETGV